MTTYQRYCSLNVDGALISLEQGEPAPFFCYPKNAKAIGLEGAVLYCFLDGYGETVFACNPESCGESYVYPLAKTFEDFLRLILACGSANPVEQIVWMDRQQFEQHLREEKESQSPRQKEVLALLAKELQLAPMEEPFAYVKALQAAFDPSGIDFRDEYYEVLGIQR